jgi:protein involved in polysaccharide export with SLBB domain
MRLNIHGTAVSRWFPVALLLLLAAGCAAGGRTPIRTELQPFSPQDQALRAAAQGARYRLRVGDSFTVDFKYQDELDEHNITILPDGRFTMPGLEDVKGLGLTTMELDSLITAHFAKDYRNPELSVLVDQLGERQVYVLGEVKVPGQYKLPGEGGGVLQAVAMAGGMLANAATSQAVLIRVTPEGYLYRHCDLSHLEKNGLGDLAYMDLQTNDIIYVPRNAIGDFAQFFQTVLPSVLDVSRLYWDIYALRNIDKIDRIVR